MKKNEILIDLSESKKTQFGKEDLALQSFPQKVFSAIWALESEVNNGGFWQYFANGSAESAPFVVEALQAIGAQQASGICRRAIAAAFPGGLPNEWEAVRSAAENFPDETREKLDALDREFFGYPDNLTNLLFVFVSKHPEEFGSLPTPSDL